MFIKEKDVRFKAVRAQGPGGQRANRRSTKVQLWVKIGDLPLLDVQKKKLRKELVHHINGDDEIWVRDEEERFQERNREKALEHLNTMIGDALKTPKLRIPTEPPRSREDDRIREKKIIGEKKRSRRLSH
ncbi:MAG: hypothetical protein UY23_C0001G0119 [Candidatus Jorgensenbacteria bacterium GW2011_GWA1_48_11]|uniref:Prokaryotic-type class I peptide chain release factors domain-containing protein n=1 Tax=Candidatus Jorgensenbacteria bacterium GW2011_GWA1_48_11 TaxID=1618660 RepID=A0A0G1WMF1_9BACT|nr:MAG: hypothetical protein UY23_C0001G0119 [Candidatus Jorgensenbacteria bacterium GW2011_GWA1_48_11]KKW12006.1 MAG: hypothetical protein UY51_C0005G0248 [Candidatus Jorgensenbacteria bacterium GW2011_GWB1_49_9]